MPEDARREQLPRYQFDVCGEHQISRSRRQELQQLFELARRILVNEPSEAVEAVRRFQYCLEQDPKNRIYIDAFFQAVEGLYPTPPASHHRWFDRANRKWKNASRKSSPAQVLRCGPAMLARNPWDTDVLLTMATACQKYGYLDAALRYLRNALEDPKDALKTHRQYARTLGWSGRFVTARECWKRVLELSECDTEALKMHELLACTADSSSASPAPSELPQDADTCLTKARAAADQGDFELGHVFVAHANSLAAGYLPIQDLAETLQLEQADHRLETAKNLHTFSPSAATWELIENYEANRHRVALEVYNARALRYPEEAVWKLELGRVLRVFGKFREAIGVLQEVTISQAEYAEASLEEGECHQLQRDFSEAIRCYTAARAVCDKSTPRELRDKIESRHTRLAEAIREP
jgi:tetratricopeptide (TPR) repeat protein